MGFSYRTDDFTKWGAGQGRDLYAVEVDLSFWYADLRLTALEARPLPSVISDFEVIGTTFYIHLDNSASYGPYALPVAFYRSRGAWTPLTDYAVLDTFTINGKLYPVELAHTSDTVFDAGATDGSGNDLYGAPMLELPGNSLPEGGATGQHLVKSTSADFAVTWAWIFPVGGTTGKFLRQASNTQDDTEWATPDASEIGFTPVTSSALEGQSSVADALEFLASGLVTDASQISFTPPTGSAITGITVQDAITDVEALAAESPVSAGAVLTTPAGNVSTTEKAMGLGFSFNMTPTKSGNVLVWIGGVAINTTAPGSGVTITGRYGTGTPPSNADTSGLGTQFGTPQHFVGSTTAGQQGFMVMGKISGLTPGDAYWFDLSIVAVTSGGATVKDTQFIAIEV